MKFIHNNEKKCKSRLAILTYSSRLNTIIIIKFEFQEEAYTGWFSAGSSTCFNLNVQDLRLKILGVENMNMLETLLREISQKSRAQIVFYCSCLSIEENPEQGKEKIIKTEKLPWRHSPTWRHEVK